MNTSTSTVGKVCLCEWSGPVTVTMVVSLLSELKLLEAKQKGSLALILRVNGVAARSISQRSSAFPDVFPALWTYCREIVMVCEDSEGSVEQLRRTLCGSASTPVASLARPLVFFELFEDALNHVQGVHPHDVLEMRRTRLRNGFSSRVGCR